MPTWRKPKAHHFKAVFLTRVRNGYLEVDSTTSIDMSKPNLSYKGHSFELKLSNDLYTDKNGTTFIFYDLEKGDMLTFEKVESLMKTTELDDFVEKSLFGQLTKILREALNPLTKGWIVPIIIGAIMGGAIAYIVAMNYIPPKIEYVPINATSPNPPIVSYVINGILNIISKVF